MIEPMVLAMLFLLFVWLVEELTRNSGRRR